MSIKAVTLSSFTGTAGIAVRDVPEPTAAVGEVLVAVEAAALGPWDVATADGLFAGVGGATTFPQILGWDFAGVTLTDGAALPAGSPVLGFVAQPWSTTGVFAERVAIAETLLSLRPPELTAEAAAALPVSVLTAQLLVESAAVSAGDRVLVVGAAGAVGRLAVQLAVERGADVRGSGSPAQEATITAAGATFVDRSADLGTGTADVTLDTVGGGAAAAALAAVVDGGRYATTQPVAPEPERGIAITPVGVQPDAAALTELAGRVAAGHLIGPAVEATVPLADAPAALERLAAGGLAGKLVLLP